MKIPVLKERGQGAAEYALLIAIIALMVIAMLALVHDRTIQDSIVKILEFPDPPVESTPQQEAPDPIVNKVIDIIDTALLVAVGIFIAYSFMHLKGQSYHRRKQRLGTRKRK